MIKFKEMFKASGIKQQMLMKTIHKVDPRVDKSLMSKFVNQVCLPTVQQLKEICKVLKCGVLDLYDEDDLNFFGTKKATQKAKPKDTESATSTKYNLTVEIDRGIAARVFSPEAMKKLKIRNRTDYIRCCIDRLVRRLNKMEAEERKKIALGSDKPKGD